MLLHFLYKGKKGKMYNCTTLKTVEIAAENPLCYHRNKLHFKGVHFVFCVFRHVMVVVLDQSVTAVM